MDVRVGDENVQGSFWYKERKVTRDRLCKEEIIALAIRAFFQRRNVLMSNKKIRR